MNPLPFSLIAIFTSATAALADDALTNNICAIAVIESGDNMRARGTKGERTAWQIMPATWAQYSKPDEHITLRGDAFKVAKRIYTHNFMRFQAERGAAPTHIDDYAMWNLGFAGYKRRGFNIERCPYTTRDAAMRYATICENVYERN